MRAETTVLLIASFVALYPIALVAQPTEAKGCAAFDEAIEGSLKEVAFQRADGIGDNSAPRATMKELRINNQLLLLSMNLELRRESGCPPMKQPISTARYLKQALTCQNDLLSVQLGKEVAKSSESGLPVSCDTATWKTGG